ncbi:YfgM family protein [Sinimarinibacterium thermocellulolyticum]|uniref:Tetratricopeptide repeat protein n=1 Tax=Sinimarinibacterium thermocellulolyticum TaxID=3170016 RepID=A0ABV2AAT8_9GAMM
MATHYDDEDQAERLKQWWRENWTALAGGLIIGLGAIFGWEGFKSHQDRRAQAASRMYGDLKLAIADARLADARDIGDALVAEHGRSPYASAAALFLAAEAVKAGDFAAARERLAWVRQHGYDDGVRQIATLREARVVWQQGETDTALALLDAKAGPFQAQFDELRGDIVLARGDRAAARSAYEKALDALGDEVPGLRDSLQRKLDDLAVAQS